MNANPANSKAIALRDLMNLPSFAVCEGTHHTGDAPGHKARAEP
jgi:hypothetical protein